MSSKPLECLEEVSNEISTPLSPTRTYSEVPHGYNAISRNSSFSSYDNDKKLTLDMIIEDEVEKLKTRLATIENQDSLLVKTNTKSCRVSKLT